jgi:DNA-binding protein HU-beta
MNKKELIAEISHTSGLSKTDSETALNAVISCLTDLLAKGGSIVLPGFASLSVKERPARTGRNPATGQQIDIAASKKVSFKTGTKLKEAVNGQ